MTTDTCFEPVIKPLIQQKKRGFTLTEIAIVLGIIGIVLGAIWVAAAAVYQNQRISHMNTAVLQIVSGVRGLYASQTTMTAGDQSSALINAGVIPNDLVSGTTLISPWGGKLYVGGVASTGTQFAVEFDSMSAPVCIGVVSALAGPARDISLANTSVTGAVALTAFVTPVNTGTALTTAVAPILGGTIAAGTGTGCTAVNINNVTLVYSLKG